METQTFKQAVEAYREDSGRHFIKPVRSTSHYSRDAWFLLDSSGGIVAIVAPESCCWGAKLQYYYHELGRGNAA